MTRSRLAVLILWILALTLTASSPAEAFAGTAPTPPTIHANLTSVSTGNCLTVPGAAASTGLVLPQSACGPATQQSFSFIGQANGNYIIHPPESLNLCLDINDSGVIVQNYCLPTASQQWLSTLNTDGSSSLINQQNGQCLVVTPAGTGAFGGFSTAVCVAATPTQEFNYSLAQPYTPPAPTGTRSAPPVPIANPTVGEWQAGMFNGLPYRIMFPANYNPSLYVYPIAIFLHGAGESGTDNLIQLRNDMYLLPADMDFRAKVPLILVAPQCPTTDNWGNPLNILPTPTETLTVQLMQMLVASLSVDPTHVSVTGLSMGGIGTWDMINRYSSFFAAAAPVAGAGYYTEIPNLLHVPIMAVHGTADTVISPLFDAYMYQVIHMYGGAMIYFPIAGAGHDVWDDAYPLTSFWQWMYTQKHI